MQKLLRILAAAFLAVGMATSVAAAQTGTIRETGPDSNNVIDIDNDSSCDVNNNTDIDVDNDTDQDATTGDATVRGNTRGGSASTGDASNSNSTDVNIGVDNSGGCGDGGGTTHRPDRPNRPTDGRGGGDRTHTPEGDMGRGGGNVVHAQSPAVLPNTGESTPMSVASLGTVILGGLAVVLRGGVALSRRFML